MPSFDLHAGLAACAGHLERFGGHRAAAGLTIRAEQLEAFAEAFAAHADAELVDEDLASVTRIDAIVPAAALTLDLARELEQLSPFGLGNPDVTLLVAGCEAVGASTVGEGKHLRFRVRQHGRDAGSAIAFGLGAQLERLQAESRFDVAFRLKQNRWNGTVAPQLVVRRVFDTSDAYEELRTWLAELWRAGETAWTPEARRIFGRALDRRRGREAAAARVADVPGPAGARRAAHPAAGGVGTRRSPTGLRPAAMAVDACASPLQVRPRIAVRARHGWTLGVGRPRRCGRAIERSSSARSRSTRRRSR